MKAQLLFDSERHVSSYFFSIRNLGILIFEYLITFSGLDASAQIVCALFQIQIFVAGICFTIVNFFLRSNTCFRKHALNYVAFVVDVVLGSRSRRHRSRSHIWINFAVLTCTARTPPVVEQWGDEYPLFR